ncbi:unnamed protein product [Closterium sp. NIES-53]
MKITLASFESRLLEAESTALAVAASCRTPLPSVLEGCSPSPLAPCVAFAAAVDFLGAEEVGAASAPSGRRRSSKGKVARVGVVGVAGATVVAVEVVGRWRRKGSGGGGGGGGNGGGGGGGGGNGGTGTTTPRRVILVYVVAGGVVDGGGGGGEDGGGNGGGGGGGGEGKEEVEAAEEEEEGVVGAVGVVEGVGVALGVELAEEGLEVRPLVHLRLVVQRVVEVALGVVSSSSQANRCSSCRSSFVNGRSDVAAQVPQLAVGTSVAQVSLERLAEPEEALHTFTLDSDVSRCIFRVRTTVTLLIAPVPITLAESSGGPVVVRGATVLLCPVAPCGLLIGLHLPSFAKNLAATSVLQDQWFTITQPGGELLAICADSRTGEHLATFTRRPGSGLYTLTTESAQVAESGQVAAPVEVTASCLCRLLTHQNLLWHHHLGHPSLPRLRGMHSRLLVSGLPRSLPPLPRSLAPPCLPCVEGQQRAAPHSSFPPTTAPLQTLHMDVWGLASVIGQGGERYFLLVVDDYTRYTTVFPLQSKADVCGVLIRSIRAARLQLRAKFRQDLPILRLHSDRGGEFSSRLLKVFCGAEGIVQTFMLPASP